jgi:hypothetical protein
LPGLAARRQIAPPQTAGFRNAQASAVEQPEQRFVARTLFRNEHSPHVFLANDSFRQALLITR